MTDTPKQVVPSGTPEGGDLININKSYSGALDPDLAEQSDALSHRIDTTLNAFDFVFVRLRMALEAHAIKLEGGSLEHRELGTDLRLFLPILSATVQQENKVHETIEQRVGKAGKYAIDLERARSEISGRLARINDAEGRGDVSGRPE